MMPTFKLALLIAVLLGGNISGNISGLPADDWPMLGKKMMRSGSDCL